MGKRLPKWMLLLSVFARANTVRALRAEAESGNLGSRRSPSHPTASTVPASSPAETTSSAGKPSRGKSEDAESFSLPPVPTNRYFVFFAIAIIGAGSDLWTKQAIFAWRGLPGTSPIYWLVDGYAGIETAVNIGAVFGIGAGKGQLFAVISVIAAVFIFVWLFVRRAANQWLLTIALACVMGGIIGNLYDRLGFWWQPGMPEQWQSGVRDWILWQASDRWRWPNFNIADSLLVCGAAALVYRSFLPVESSTEADHSNNHETTTLARNND